MTTRKATPVRTSVFAPLVLPEDRKGDASLEWIQTGFRQHFADTSHREPTKGNRGVQIGRRLSPIECGTNYSFLIIPSPGCAVWKNSRQFLGCIVAQLGELTEDQERRWQRTAVFHSRHEDGEELPLVLDAKETPPSPNPDVVRIRLGKVRWTNARAFGDVWLGWQLWKTLDLDKIVARHIKIGRETVPPASMVAIEVISRLCIGQGGETSEFGLAEHGYRRTALEDLLGVPDDQVTKDRLDRTLDALLEAKEPIEQDLQERLGELFSLQFDLLLCDLTSSFFEGLMEESELAKRGNSRDHRSDCKQIVLAMVVTRDGFPVYHQVFAGNMNDATAFPDIVETMESRFGKAQRVWVSPRQRVTLHYAVWR